MRQLRSKRNLHLLLLLQLIKNQHQVRSQQLLSLALNQLHALVLHPLPLGLTQRLNPPNRRNNRISLNVLNPSERQPVHQMHVPCLTVPTDRVMEGCQTGLNLWMTDAPDMAITLGHLITPWAMDATMVLSKENYHLDHLPMNRSVALHIATVEFHENLSGQTDMGVCVLHTMASMGDQTWIACPAKVQVANDQVLKRTQTVPS